jgi:hypothetical protein
MRAVLFFACSLLSLGLSACRAEGTAPTSEPNNDRAPATAAPSSVPQGARGGVQQASAQGIAPLDKKKFGEPITEATTTPLMSIIKAPAQFTSKAVRTEGMVTAVCQAMGCWMQIADTSGKAHIKMAGHSFFVPKESSGHRAIVQGKVLSGGQPNSCAAGDGCGNQEATQVQIEATGVEFID